MISHVWPKHWILPLLILMTLAAFTLGLLGCGASQPPSTSAPMTSRLPEATPVGADLEIKRARVWYEPPKGASESLDEGAKRQVYMNDRLRLENQAEALLSMVAYVIHLYRDTQVVAHIDRASNALSNLGLVYGALYADDFGWTKASEYLTIETEAAVIKALGTKFFIYHDTRTATTWVVVLEDSVQVQGAGVPVTVTAGWQTWVAPNSPPQPPSPALRSDLGDRFPRIEALTNGSLSDNQILPNLTRCSVTGNPSISVEVRDRPDETALVIATMPRDRAFGAVARSADASWVYGYGGDQRTIGWVRVEAIDCAMPVGSLPIQGGQAVPATPPPPAPVSPATVPPSPNPIPTEIPQPSSTSTPIPCVDASRYVSDVTIPDGAFVSPGARFTKTWRIQNAGNCPWPPGYQLVFVSGQRMGGQNVSLSRSVPPGGTSDISVVMVAPTAPGSYQGEWKLLNSDGTRFGDALTVQIEVPTPTPLPQPTAAPAPQPTAMPAPQAPAVPPPPPAAPAPQITAAPASPATTSPFGPLTVVVPPAPITATSTPSLPAIGQMPRPQVCIMMGGLTLTAQQETSKPLVVVVRWNTDGSCTPFNGTLTARFSDKNNPYKTYTITGASGSVRDAPPSRLNPDSSSREGPYTVIYTLTLQDNTGSKLTREVKLGDLYFYP